ncbi:MAG: ShlB/FhaC/HecB family hemolysin secretion/activation protein [Microcystaceae cyanobacterium]
MKPQFWPAVVSGVMSLLIGIDSIKAEENKDYLICPYTSPSLSPNSFNLTTITFNDRPLVIQIQGSTLLSSAALLQDSRIQELVTQHQEKNFTEADLKIWYENLGQAINFYYLSQGYLTSQVASTADNLIFDQNTLIVPVIEGKISQIQISNQGRLTLPYLCDRLALGITSPVNINQLEANFRLMSQNPLIENIKGDLKASGEAGSTILLVTIEEADPFNPSVGIDNYSPPSIGSERTWVSFRHGNVTGWGDEMTLSYYRSLTGGSDVLEGSWRFPVNPQEGTIQFRASPNWTRVTQSPFDQFNIKGNKDVYEFKYRQPLWRNLRDELALSVGFRYIDSTNSNIFLERPDLFGQVRTSVLQFEQDYSRRDQGGLWFVRSQLNWGTGLLDATQNPDSFPDGVFLSWSGQIQRLQRLGNDHLLIIQGELQLTPDPLTSDYLFIMGGGQSVRGYRQNVRSGDNGYRFSLEDRINLYRDEDNISRFQIAPFIDLGKVWNTSKNPTSLPSQTFLIGVGLGIIWQPLDQFSLRVDYGLPIINLDDRGRNAQDDGWHFQTLYKF